MAILLALTTKKFSQENLGSPQARELDVKSLASSILYITIILIVSVIPLAFLLIGNNILGYLLKTSLPPMATIQTSLTLRDILNFFAPAWLQVPLTASQIIGEGYNFIRLFILAIGVYQLFQTGCSRKLQFWICSTAVSYLIAWFTIVIFLQNLSLDPYRFAFVLDLMLLPIAGLLIHDLFQAFFSRVFNTSDKKLRKI
jgi:hypothetical protein